jgi:hypothetical protein
MKRRREAGAGLAARLAAREVAGTPPGAAAPAARRLAEALAPTGAARGVAPPRGLCACRFTPDGAHLVSFDVHANEVVLHRYLGPHSIESSGASGPGSSGAGAPPPAAPPPGAARFADAFAEHARAAPASGLDEALVPFCLVAHGRFLILASAAPEAAPPAGGAGGARLGVGERAALHLVRVADGAVLDRLPLPADAGGPPGPGAASLFGDLLAVLSPRAQRVVLLRVTRTGRFERAGALGRRLREDDGVPPAAAAAAEARWRAGQVAEAAPAAPGAPGAAAPDGEEVDAAAAPPPPPVEGLRQRLLARLYLLARARAAAARALEAAAPPPASAPPAPAPLTATIGAAGADGLPAGVRALAAFYYFFQSYAELRMGAVALLSPTRLAVHWRPGGAGAPPPRHPGAHRGLVAVHDLESTRVVELFGWGSPAHAAWRGGAGGAGAGGAPACDWERALAPGPWAAAAAAERGAAAAGWPPACQARSPSPYLDAELFRFPEALVPPSAAPGRLPTRAAKFVARRWPERLRFRLDPEDLAPVEDEPLRQRARVEAAAAAEGAGGGGAEEQQPGAGGPAPPPPAPAPPPPAPPPEEVVFLFHPCEPFVLAAVEDAEAGAAERVTFFGRWT